MSDKEKIERVCDWIGAREIGGSTARATGRDGPARAVTVVSNALGLHSRCRAERSLDMVCYLLLMPMPQ